MSTDSERAAATAGATAATHLLVFPFPAHGHMVPLLDLAHHLAARSLAVTVVVTAGNLPVLQPLLSRSPAIQPLVLPFPDHPSIPAGVENARDLPRDCSIATFIHALAGLRPHLLHWFRSQAIPPAAILSDFFLGWTHHIAAELRVPSLTFYPSGAFLVSVIDYLWHTMPPLDGPPNTVLSLDALPGSPAFSYAHLPPLYARYRAAAGSPEWEALKDSMLANAAGWGTVINTFDGLEGPYLAHLKRSYGHSRVWAVGPVAPATPAEVRGGRSAIPAGELAAWLDAQPTRSVVYVCFGSVFRPTPAQGRALASALELSGAHFVWCVGAASDAVPAGFEERTAAKGLVIRGWAPQVAILGHPAVGSFLTHCGWNSLLEGITAGVVLLTWPLSADQFVNARLLTEDAGTAVRACAGGRDSVPDPESLSRVLAESVDKEKWRETRARAAEMKWKARLAVGEGGRSFHDVEALVNEINGLKVVAKQAE